MTNVTFSVNEKLYSKMKKHPEIKWSEIFRSAIKDYLIFLERPKIISGQELFESITISVQNNSLEKELEIRKKQQELEKQRVNKILELESQFSGE
ncbi:MAG: hypothetical protein ACTSRK_06630 [Promethearchaeota archaeon]